MILLQLNHLVTLLIVNHVIAVQMVASFMIRLQYLVVLQILVNAYVNPMLKDTFATYVKMAIPILKVVMVVSHVLVIH